MGNADEKPIPSPRRRRPGAWLCLFALGWFLFWGRGMPTSGDERETLEVANGLLRLGQPVRLAMDGRSLGASKYGIGQSVIDLPGLWADQWLAALWPDVPPYLRFLAIQLPGSLEAAAAAWLLFAIGMRLGYGRRRSVWIALAAATATPLWDYSRTEFADLTVAAATLGAVWAALRFETAGRRALDALGAGLFLGLAMITKTPATIVVPFVGLFFLWVGAHGNDPGRPAQTLEPSRSIRCFLLFAAPLAAAASWMLFYNWLRYGAAWVTGYEVSADKSFGFGTPLWVGLYGLLFSSGKSVFLYSPLLLAALGGWAALWRRRRAAAALLGLLVVSAFLFYARWWAWHGDWSWADRHILYATTLALLPLGELGLGAQESAARRRMRRAILGALAAVGFAVNLLGVLVWHSLPFYFGSDQLETPVFKEPRYREGAWEIRDDFAHFHFIPEFSPVATHLWLARAIWNRERWSDEEIARRAPWMSLNAAWKPRVTADYRAYFFYDVWWHRPWAEGQWGARETCLLLLFAALALGSLAAALRSISPSGDGGKSV
ncbi:MAG: hypothetical protein NTW86_17910 [Candidatus Sumerlaeota bacterium]|nr:hypothetical protein [Candidatus Sumerlaeota bacterium]